MTEPASLPGKRAFLAEQSTAPNKSGIRFSEGGKNAWPRTACLLPTSLVAVNAAAAFVGSDPRTLADKEITL